MTWLSDATLARLGAVAGLPDPGSLDGRYELLEPVGRGGMGVVWRARDHSLGREVALKLLDAPAPGAAAAQAELRARLLREARVLARLEHPGIVPVHDAGTLPDGRVFYAMKLVRGRRLDEVVRAGCPLGERLRIFERLCEAVAFAHAQGVLHRDLKPDNVMVGAFGEVLVLDWGVARVPEAALDVPPGARDASDTPPRGTAHGTVLGTPGYMAPEQARGEVEQLDARADVFSLGAVLHFLLTGSPPARDGAGLTRASTWTWARRATVEGAASASTSRLPPDIPVRLGAIVLTALASDPARRYAGAGEMAADVVRFQAGEPVDAYPEGVLDKARRLAARHRVAIVLVLTYVAMRAALLYFTGR